MNDPIWLPCAAMAGLTALVWVKLYADRLSEMRARRIAPQELATAREAAGRLEKPAAADNFRNLFEVPVLFYVLCIALVLNGGNSARFFKTMSRRVAECLTAADHAEIAGAAHAVHAQQVEAFNVKVAAFLDR